MREFFLLLMKRSFWMKLVLLFFLGFLMFTFFLSRSIFRFFTVRTTESVRFVVDDRESLDEVAHDLSEKKVIASERFFLRYFSIFRKLSPTPGVYIFPEQSSTFDVARILSLSSSVTPETKITFPEGLSLDAYGQRLEKAGILSADAFVVSAGSADFFREKYPFLQDVPEDQGLIGYLFPETYFFLPESSFEIVAQKMLDGFQARLGKDLLAAKEKGENIHDILTLASIVEAEARTDQDRRTVAGVFQNRLKIGMPLQSDVTVLFATGNTTSSPTAADLQFDSPYNTYKHAGLPPGPMNNPSASSVEAVLDPILSDYLYFLATPDGKVLYTKTYEEHLANKKKYL